LSINYQLKHNDKTHNRKSKPQAQNRESSVVAGVDISLGSELGKVQMLSNQQISVRPPS
jgi:hypothetical protein